MLNTALPRGRVEDAYHLMGHSPDTASDVKVRFSPVFHPLSLNRELD